LINALKLKQFKITGELTETSLESVLAKQKMVISGAGAAAIAIGKLLHQAGATNIIFADSKGLISSSR
jgi:malic enzyme